MTGAADKYSPPYPNAATDPFNKVPGMNKPREIKAADVELLPCPFCGDGEHLLVEHLEGTIIHPAHRIRCDTCGASTGYTDKDFRADWNTRAQATAAKDAEIEALRAEVAEARDGWHMANGAAELAMKHRDAAEARAERLKEALRHVKDKLETVAAIRGAHGTFAGTYLIVTEALDPTAALQSPRPCPRPRCGCGQCPPIAPEVTT